MTFSRSILSVDADLLSIFDRLVWFCWFNGVFGCGRMVFFGFSCLSVDSNVLLGGWFMFGCRCGFGMCSGCWLSSVC